MPINFVTEFTIHDNYITQALHWMYKHNCYCCMLYMGSVVCVVVCTQLFSSLTPPWSLWIMLVFFSCKSVFTGRENVAYVYSKQVNRPLHTYQYSSALHRWHISEITNKHISHRDVATLVVSLLYRSVPVELSSDVGAYRQAWSATYN